jgi:hypothetical protein
MLAATASWVAASDRGTRTRGSHLLLALICRYMWQARVGESSGVARSQNVDCEVGEVGKGRVHGGGAKTASFQGYEVADKYII